MLTALAAVLIGVSALFVSIYQASIMREQQRIMREQQRASVWPYLEIGTNFNSTGLRIRVMNQGVGPARIQAVEVTVDDDAMMNWSAVLSALLESPNVPHVRRSISGRVLAPDSEITIFELTPPRSDTVVTKLNRLGLRL